MRYGKQEPWQGVLAFEPPLRVRVLEVVRVLLPSDPSRAVLADVEVTGTIRNTEEAADPLTPAGQEPLRSEAVSPGSSAAWHSAASGRRGCTRVRRPDYSAIA